MNIERPIITSMLDCDLYKLNMGSVAFHMFPRAEVEYTFFNRGKTQFPEGFDKALQHQVNLLSKLALTDDEETWLKSIPYIRPTYVEWLKGYRMNPKEVIIRQVNGSLYVTIRGPWYRTIFWEVKLMAIISELYFLVTGQESTAGWMDKIERKAEKLSKNGCHWIDFGTRRRYSFEVQNRVVEIMKNYQGFLGTSNPYLAFKYGVTPHGTYAHESVMAMSALYGDFSIANKMWMKHWSEHFDGNVGVALTDTFTTDVFLRDFGNYEARLFDGTRQDSDDEYKWGNKMLAHYKKLNILTSNKRMVFSNALDTDKYIAIDKYFRQFAQPCGGIGTHFSNDVGVKPLNIVVKMTQVDFGRGWVDVVKLSDDISKSTGNIELIAQYKKKLNIS